MRVAQVFTPNGFPGVTFIDDHLNKKGRDLLDSFESGTNLVSISGPSKSGKTVFVEKFIGKDNLIHITGAGIDSVKSLWSRVFDLLGTPIPQTASESSSLSGTVSGKAGASAGIIFAKAQAEGSLSGSYTTLSSSTDAHSVDMLQLLIKDIANTDFVVFIDDFHYIQRDVQIEVAKQIKEATRQNCKFICASVPYHSDDVIRSNPDLRGRLVSIDFNYWDRTMLTKIAEKGLAALGIEYDIEFIESLAAESAGSPQLMQYLCLYSCFEMDIRESPTKLVKFTKTDALHDKICRRTIDTANYTSVVERMLEGPKIRGSDRKVYISKDGWQGDVYKYLVKALSLNPPQLTFRYQHLIDRINSLCLNESPSGSSITSACTHSSKIANDAANDSIIEWDSENDVLDIRDPYLSFFIRWTDII